MARRLGAPLLAVVWGASGIWLGAAGDPPVLRTDVKWMEALPTEDDIFHSCDYTSRFVFKDILTIILGQDNDWRKNSAVVNYYKKSANAQSLFCTHTDQLNEKSRKVDCSEQPICKKNGKDRETGCPAFSDDYNCPKCDGTKMTEHYCARLCTQWFVRKSQHKALQRYGVIAALRKGEECWCTPFGGARDDDETDYADDKPKPGGRFVADDQVVPWPCMGNNATTCGGQCKNASTACDKSEELETAVKIYCHSSVKYFIFAVAPFVLRLLDCLFGICEFCRLKCHRCRDDSVPPRAFTMSTLCGGTFNAWHDAVEVSGMSQKSAVALALFRLLCYILQPTIFVYLLIHYALQKEMIDPTQTWLGCAVAVREGIYCLMIACCVIWKPSFLLINNAASVRGTARGDPLHQGGIFLLLMIFAPEKFVAQVLFQPGGLSPSGTSGPAGIGNQAEFQRRADCINHWYFLTLAIGFLLDLCAFCALYQGYSTGQLPWSLSFGYFITTGRVFWMLMVLLSDGWDCLKKRHCGPTRERRLSDDLNTPLNDSMDAPERT